MRRPTPELQVTVKQIKKLIPTVLKKQISSTFLSDIEVDVYTLSNWDEHPSGVAFALKKSAFILNSLLPIIVECSANYDAEAVLHNFKERYPEKDADASNLIDLDLTSDSLLGMAKVIFAACIARPGTFGSYLAEDSEVRFDIDDHCIDISKKYGWPPISDLDLESVYRWLSKVEGFDDGFGYNALGRALAAFSYAVTSGHSKTDVLWPLIGLEALYCREREALARQILQKSDLFLGPRREFKSKFKSLYETRSQFIHGAMDFPFSFCPYDAEPEYEESHRKIYVSQDLGTAILIATFQKLVLEGRWDLEFGYYRLSEKGA